MLLFLKMIHIIAVAMFLGNMIVTGEWKKKSEYYGTEVRIFGNKLAKYTDHMFVEFYGLIVIGSGSLLVYLHPVYTFTTKWVMWALMLWTLSLVFWLISKPYLKKQRIDLIRNEGKLYKYYDRRWWWWGVAATVADFAVLPLMIWKPS